MPSSILLLLALAGDPKSIVVGDDTISGKSIAAYEHRWQQCSIVEGAWKTGSALTEKATPIGPHLLRIEQTSSPQTGVTSKVSFYVDRKTLAPVRSEARFIGPDGNILAERSWAFDADGYKATISQQGKVTEKSGKLSSDMFNAMILGIPLAMIDDWKVPAKMTGFMTQFEASYTITAAQTGREVIRVEERNVPVRWIDIHWLHNEIGDIYPPGPNASGGRYWITEKAELGLPRVIRYKTDSYTIEYLPKYCPEIE